MSDKLIIDTGAVAKLMANLLVLQERINTTIAGLEEATGLQFSKPQEQQEKGR